MPSRVVFTEEMTTLNQEIVVMGELAKDMVRKGVQAFLEENLDLKDEVARLDKEIYRLEQVIEKRCLDLIALHQPVAVDLRTVSTCLKIITDLNRIGRYGRDIAELIDEAETIKHMKKLVAIPLMSELSMYMVTDAIDSFVCRDEAKAMTLFARDDEVDGLWDSILRESLTHMMEDPRNIGSGTYFILVARYLERIADHSCNIANRVVFMVTGRRVDPYEKNWEKEETTTTKEATKAISTDGYYTMNLDEK